MGSGINNYTTILVVFLLLLLLFKGVRFSDFNFNTMILLFILMVFFSTIFSINMFSVEMSNVVKTSIRWMGVLLYYPLANFIKHDKSKFLLVLSIMNIVCILIFAYQSFSYNLSGGQLFVDQNYFLTSSGSLRVEVRSSGIRIPLNWQIIMTSYLISLYSTFRYGLKKMHVINVVLSTFWLFFIVQTRMLIISTLISIAIVLLLYAYIHNTYKTALLATLTVFIGIIMGIIFNLGDTVTGFFDSFNESSNIMSKVVRIQAIDYFTDIIKNNLFFGNGIYVGNVGSYASYLARGPMGLYYYSDLGLLGNVAQFGILSFFVVANFCVRTYKKIMGTFKQNYLLVLFLTYYTVTTITTLSWIYTLGVIPFIVSLSFIDSELKNTTI